MTQLELLFLGPPQVEINHHPVTLPTRKTTALLAYLSIAKTPQIRSHLATLLWPNLDHMRSRAALRQALWMLRRAGISGFLKVEHEELKLKSGYSLDIATFWKKLDLVQKHKHVEEETCKPCVTLLAEAACLYRGDFLEDFTLNDSQEFDDWQLFQSESLRHAFIDTLERLVSMYVSEKEWKKALTYARRWIDVDAFSEPAHCWLMRLYAQSGKRGFALKQYETLQQTLYRELGVEPEAETIHLYEDILAGRIPAETSNLTRLSASVPKSTPLRNIPMPLTPFFGREREVSTVCDYMLRPDTHLLTLTGSPGIGKTRLSIQIASKLANHFKHGVSFVPLAPICDKDLVATTIAQSLDIIESKDRTPQTALKDYFRNKSMLLILDNFEQVLDAAQHVVELLRSCPGLKILATSRAPLKIRGERQYRLEPLRLPNIDHLPSIESLQEYPSIAIFVTQAELVDSEFTLTEGNAVTVAQICHHLEGMPLAIELAAAWIKILSPQELLKKLSNRLLLLRGGPVDLPPRQRTLRTAIDWSYDLLKPSEQILLSQLAVFLGCWTLEAAKEVLGRKRPQSEGPYSGDVLEGLSELVDKSLVKRRELAAGYVRFYMLDIIHEYASEKLLARGEKERGYLQQRHAIYYLELAEASEPALRGPQQQLWLVRLKDEHRNLCAALKWILSKNDAEMALKITGSLWRYWWTHGHLSEGRGWLQKALAFPAPQQTRLRARALNGAGILARCQGDFTNAHIYLEASLEIWKYLGDSSGEASVLNSLGVLAQHEGDNDSAYRFYEESLAHRKKIGSPREIAVSMNNLAMLAQAKGAYAQADELYSQSLTLFYQVNDARDIGATLANRGGLMIDQGDAKRAEGFFKESLSILRDLGQRDDIIECLEGFAGAALLLNQPHRGAHLLGAAQMLRETIGAPLPAYRHDYYVKTLEGLAAHLDLKTLESDLRIGKKLSLNEAIDYALSQGQ